MSIIEKRKVNFRFYISKNIKKINKTLSLLGYQILDLRTKEPDFRLLNEDDVEIGSLNIDPTSNRKLIYNDAETIVSYERYVDKKIEEEEEKRTITREIYTVFESIQPKDIEPSEEETEDDLKEICRTKIIAIHKGSKEDPNYKHIDITVKVGPFESEESKTVLQLVISPNNVHGMSILFAPQIDFCYDISDEQDNQNTNSLEDIIDSLPKNDKISFEEIIKQMEEHAMPGLRKYIDEFVKEKTNTKTRAYTYENDPYYN